MAQIRQSVHDRVRDQLAEQIAAGMYAPGEALPSERILAASMNVSRHSLRQALASMASMGLVVVRHGSGVYLPDGPSDEAVTRVADALYGARELADMLEARLLIEPGIAALAARRCTPEWADALRTAAAIDARVLPEDGEGGFHRTVARITGNPVLDGIVRSCLTGHRGVGALLHDDPEATDLWQTEHAAICSAIVEGDAGAASLRMEEHLAATLERARSVDAA